MYMTDKQRELAELTFETTNTHTTHSVNGCVSSINRVCCVCSLQFVLLHLTIDHNGEQRVIEPKTQETIIAY